MAYQDNTYKTVVVLNGKAPLGVLLNALGHSLLGLVHEVGDHSAFRFLRYEDAEGGRHPAISTYPVIILKGDNANQLRALRMKAIQSGMTYNDFAASMVGPSAEEQLARTRQTHEPDLDYLAVALFGTAAMIDPLTERFSLFQRFSLSQTPQRTAATS
jgi:hypothetical protein